MSKAIYEPSAVAVKQATLQGKEKEQDAERPKTQPLQL
jgi:hypothetical protein